MDWPRQLQDETRKIKVLGFGAAYIRALTVIFSGSKSDLCSNIIAVLWNTLLYWTCSKKAGYICHTRLC